MSKKVVLDASALLTLLQEEPGFEQIEKMLPHAIMSTVNLSEVIAVLISIGISAEEAQNIAFEFIDEIIPFDSNQASLAAFLRSETKPYGLSFGDRACLALAQMQQIEVITADKIWGKLKIKDLKVHVIRD